MMDIDNYIQNCKEKLKLESTILPWDITNSSKEGHILEMEFSLMKM